MLALPFAVFSLAPNMLAPNMKVWHFPARASHDLPAVYICTVNRRRLAALSLRGDTMIASAFVCEPAMHRGDLIGQFRRHLVEEGVQFPGDLSEHERLCLDLGGGLTLAATKRVATRGHVKGRATKAWHLKDWKDNV